MASISHSNCRKKDVYEKYHLIYEPTKLRSYAHRQHPLLTNFKTSSIWNTTTSRRLRSSTAVHCCYRSRLAAGIVNTLWTSNALLVSIVLHCVFFSWLLNYHSSQNILILLFLSFSWKYPQMALILETYTCQLLRILDWPCVSFPRMGVVYVRIFFIWFFYKKNMSQSRNIISPLKFYWSRHNTHARTCTLKSFGRIFILSQSSWPIYPRAHLFTKCPFYWNIN